MPNYVQNILKIKNVKNIDNLIEKFTSKNDEGKDYFDFNKIIPRPERLNLTEGSITDEAIKYALYKMPIEQRNFILNRINRTFKWLESDDINELNKTKERFENELKNNNKDDLEYIDYAKFGIKSFEDLGNAYINNIIDYGYATWYDWSIENWGTKWGAMENKIIKGKNYIKFYFETAWSTPLPIFEELSNIIDNDMEIWYADEDIGNNCGKIYYTNKEEIIEYKEDDREFANRVWRETEKLEG